MNYEKKAENWLKNCSDHRGEQIISPGQLIAAVREQSKMLLKYAIHKTNCKGFPAFSEQQLARDCDCGMAALERAVGEKA